MGESCLLWPAHTQLGRNIQGFFLFFFKKGIFENFSMCFLKIQTKKCAQKILNKSCPAGCVAFLRNTKDPNSS